METKGNEIISNEEHEKCTICTQDTERAAW